MSRFILLSGPSCAGKTPLLRALQRFRPETMDGIRPVVLYNSRDPRPDEIEGEHYHFRQREQIEAFRGVEGFTVFDVRGHLQALDHEELRGLLETGDVIFEGNPYVAVNLLEFPIPNGVQRLSIFIAPVSFEEIEALRARGAEVESVVADVVRHKLFRRAKRMTGELSEDDLEDIERRAALGWQELCMARKFDHIVVNHDGEDSENWTAWPHPLGDAYRTLRRVARILSSR